MTNPNEIWAIVTTECWDGKCRLCFVPEEQVETMVLASGSYDFVVDNIERLAKENGYEIYDVLRHRSMNYGSNGE